MMRSSSLAVFACLSKVCAPPPVGRGGSSPSGVASPTARKAKEFRSAVEKLGWKVTSTAKSKISNSRYFRIEKRFPEHGNQLVSMEVRMSDHSPPRYLKRSDVYVHYDRPYRTGGGVSMSSTGALSHLENFYPTPFVPLAKRRSFDKTRNLVEGRRTMVEKARKVVANPRRYHPEKVRRSEEIIRRFADAAAA